ncbi:MAG TPA: LolA-related protein [Rhodoferax sp.]
MPSQPLRRRLKLFTAILGMVLCASSYAADWALPDLMHVLAQKKSGKASFVEKKYIGILDKPLESSGELSFEAPDRLEKRTLKPNPETMLLDGDKLTITLHEKRPLYLRLQDHPEVAALVDSIRGTLSGDQVALEKNYALEFTGVQSKWQLTLTPVQKAVTKVVSQIRIGGADANLKTITFDQVDGDRSEMTISKVVTP